MTLPKAKTLARLIISRPILRNLLLLGGLGVLLAINPSTIADYVEDYYYVASVDCSPCWDIGFDQEARAYGTGHCKEHTSEGELPTGTLTMGAEVWWICNFDGLTSNEAEVDALNEGQDGMLAEARAIYIWHECADEWDFEYCGDNPGDYGFDEEGCPWW